MEKELDVNVDVNEGNPNAVSSPNVDPIYKHKDGRIFTKKQLLSEGYNEERIKTGLDKNLITLIGDTRDADQEFKHEDGRIFTNKQLLSEGYTQERIDNGILGGKISPIEKKNQVASAPTSKDLSVGVSDGTISTTEPPKNAIDLSFDAFNLENQKITRRAPATIGFGTGGGEVVTTEEDPQAKAASKKIKEDLKAQGYDADKLYDDFKDIDFSGLNKEEADFKKQGLLNDYKENPQQYEKKVATYKFTNFLNKAVSELSEEERKSGDFTFNLSPMGDYNSTRAKYNEIKNRIKEYGGDYEKELLKNFSIAVGDYYGQFANDPSVIDDERNKYLNQYQILALQYLEDTNPDAAKGYGSMLVDPSLIKKGSAEEAGWQEKASSLEQIGLRLSKSNIESEILRLANQAKTSPLSIQDAALAKELETKLTDIDNKIKEINLKYPIPADKEAKMAAMDLTDNAMSNALTRPFLSIGNAIDNTWKGIYDFAREPFSNDEQSKLYQLAAAGESIGKDIQMYLPKKRTTLQNYDWQMSPEVLSQYKKIMDDASISKDEKTRKVYDLLQKNPDGFARIPIVGGKINITPTSLYYSVVDLGASLVPYLALESVTAGGATAGIVRKISSSFMAAAATGFHDNYVAAVREGAANPYKQALITTGIMSTAMAGAGTPQMIRAMIGDKTAVGELVSKLTDKEISVVLDKIKNGTLKNRILDYGKSLGKDAVKSITEGAKGGAKFEGIMVGGKALDKKIKGQEINTEELAKEGAIGILNFTVFGGVMGIGKSAWKGVTDFQASTLLKASQNPTEYLKAAAKSLADGTITNKDYNQIKSNIELASKVSEGVKFIDDKGVELSESKKAKLLLAKMQEAKLNEDAQGDIPSKLKEDLDNQIGEVKLEIGKIQESGEEVEVPKIKEGERVYRIDYTDPETGKKTYKLFENQEEGTKFLNSIPGEAEGYYEKYDGKSIISTFEGAIKPTKAKAEEVKAEEVKVGEEVPQAELPVAEEKPTLTAIEQEETIKQIKPFTDRMVEIERDFKNEGFEIDTDYDNEIVVTDKKGEIVDAEELPDNLRKLAGDYEKATMKLGEFDASAREKALIESRKVTKVEAEVVEPKKAELPFERENWTQDDYKKELKRLEKEDAKGNADKIKQLQTELGTKLRGELVKPKEEKVEKKKAETKEESSVQKALNEYEEEGGTFNDLVDKIEGIAFDEENQNLQDAVDAYRKEQKEDFELAGRGDMDAAEAAFMSKIKVELPPTPEKVTPKVEEQITPKINKDTKTEYTTKSGKQKINKVNGELIVTDAKTGKRVSKPTERKAIKEWEENFNFSEGEMAPEFSGYGGTSTETAYAEHVIETSENPLEIAQIFIAEEYEPAKLSTKESLIAEFGIGKTTNKSFQRFGDRNLITLSLAKAYLSNKEGASLDVIAKEMSDHYGYEITPQDLVDFMVRFPNGVKDALKMSETEVAQNAYEKFKKLTGLELTRPLAERLIQKEFDKLSSEQQKIINEDYETAKQLEDEYWKTYKETNGFTKESVSGEVKPAIEAKPKEPAAEKVEPKAELPKEEVKEYNSKNLPNPIGEFEVVNVIPYTTAEKNKFAPNQQLKFNQGDKYEPVRIVGDSELIELIQIGSRERSNLTSSVKKPINRVRQKVLEDKYGIRAYEASERARELAKQNRGDVENIIIIGEKPIEKPTAEKVEPKAELPKEEKIAEKTPLQKASEARRAAKAKLDSLRKGLGINEQAKLEALVDYHRTLVAEAKEFIKEKADDINEWAKSIGEKVNIVLQKAWDEAKGAKPVEKAEDLGYGIEDVEIKKVGLSKAEIAKQVEEFGMMQPSRRAKITDAELDQMADDAINAGYNVQGLIDRLRIESTKPLEERQPANDLEVTILNQYAAALNAEQTINPSKETLKKYAEALDAARKAFSITGATLRQAQRSQMVVDNLSNFLVDKENAQGAPLTEKQLKEETAKFQELKAAKDALEQALKEEKEKNEKLIAEIGFNKAKALRKREAKKTNEEYKAERKAILDAAKEALQSIPKGGELYSTIPGLPQTVKKLQQLKTIAPFVKEYMGTLINQGVDKLDNVVTDIHAEFKDVVEGITKNDILKIIAGVYDTPTLTRNEAASKKRLLEREAKLLNELAAARKGEEVAKTEKEKIQKSRRIQELERQIKETRELNREDAEPIEKTNAERLAAREKQLLNKIERLNQDLKSGNFLQEKKPLPPLEINPKTRALMNRVIELEEKIRAERAKDEYDKKPKWVKNLDKVSQVLGVRRLMQTAFDLSVSFRQGATLFSPRNIKIWAKSFKNEISSITPERFKKLMYEIRHSESYHEMVEDGVVFNDLGTVNEDYLNANFMQNIPGIGQGLRASQRAADGFLNTARYELYQKFRKNLERQGLTRQSDPQAYKEMASWVMAMTGRGNMIKALENPNAQQILGNTFYGARLMASRFQLLNLPSYLLPAAGVGSKFRNKEMAKESLKDMASWAGTVMAVGAALAATPGASISLNPDDSDFLQVRYGDKVYDISGGTAAYIRTFLRITQALIARATSPKYIGKKKVEKASESTLKFFRNKLAPNTSYATDAIFGGSGGREFDPYSILKIYPMYGDDLIEGLEDEGVVSLATILLPNLIGIGLNTYSAKGTVEDNLETLVKNSQTADDQNPESIKNYNKGGVPVTDEEFDKYIDKANKLIGEYVTKFYKNGKKIVNEDGTIVQKSYLELSPDEIANEIKSIKSKATKEAKEELFGTKSYEEKVEERKERARKKREKIVNQ